jgi:NADH:ubiquinone oxidoreductase subunit 4 (subunit M)
MNGSETFNLHETVQMVSQAFTAVVCHVLFDAALHGLVMAMMFAAIGFILFKRKHKLGRPFMSVGKRLSIFCALLMVPGICSLIFTGGLPSTGVFSINSLGFIVFWSLICVHLSAEEMNYQWFQVREG